eukprot:g1661.t1
MKFLVFVYCFFFLSTEIAVSVKKDDSCLCDETSFLKNVTKSSMLAAKLFETVPPTELMLIANMFFKHKVSEILMDQDVQKYLKFNNRTWFESQYSSHPLAIGMLGVSAPPEDALKQNMTLNYPLMSKPLAETVSLRLEKFGAAVVLNFIPKHECEELRQSIFDMIATPAYSFGNIQERTYRKDYPLQLSLNEPAGRIFERVSSLLAPVLVQQLGEDPLLVEYAAMLTFPGSKSQRKHADAGMDKTSDLFSWAKLYSVFVYLDDVDEDMGALDVWPGTHTHYHFLQREEKAMMDSVASIRLAVPAGSFVVYDSRLLHRGAENTSKKVRPAFYFSWISRTGKLPNGPTYSIRKNFAADWDHERRRRAVQFQRKIKHENNNRNDEREMNSEAGTAVTLNAVLTSTTVNNWKRKASIWSRKQAIIRTAKSEIIKQLTEKKFKTINKNLLLSNCVLIKREVSSTLMKVSAFVIEDIALSLVKAKPKDAKKAIKEAAEMIEPMMEKSFNFFDIFLQKALKMRGIDLSLNNKNLKETAKVATRKAINDIIKELFSSITDSISAENNEMKENDTRQISSKMYACLEAFRTSRECGKHFSGTASSRPEQFQKIIKATFHLSGGDSDRSDNATSSSVCANCGRKHGLLSFCGSSGMIERICGFGPYHKKSLLWKVADSGETFHSVNDGVDEDFLKLSSKYDTSNFEVETSWLSSFEPKIEL